MSPIRPTASALLLAILVQPAVLLAHSDTGTVKPGGRFTPNEEGAEFPPQPLQMQRIEQHKPADAAAAQDAGSSGPRSSTGVLNDGAAAILAADKDVAAALGDSYIFINTTPIIQKWSTDSSLRYLSVFYSYSRQQTIKVSTQNNSILSIEAIAAGVEQPPLSEAEMTSAIELARAHWVRVGHPDIDNLIGYAIQTYQADGSPYDSRVAYVSFHTASPELPKLLTWIDLGQRQVLRAETLQ